MSESNYVDIKLSRFTKVYPLKTCDFKKQCIPNLIYDELIENGLIVTEFYYSDEEKTDLVIHVDVTYEYGEDSLVRKIIYNVNYYDENHNIGMSYSKIKILTNRQKLKLLKNRRKTISETAQAAVIGLLRMSYPDEQVQDLLQIGGEFIIKYKNSLDIFEAAGSLKIIGDITKATEYWLDATPVALGGATIRQYLIGEFSA